MGYATYEDRPAGKLGVERWAGYAVPAVCDVPSCENVINRGMDYRCEEFVTYGEEDPVTFEEPEIVRPGCQLHFCDAHQEHSVHGDGVTPKPDTDEWVRYLLSDPEASVWRYENPDRVAKLQARIDAAGAAQ
ncbi:hypothetical protein [Leucobacter sp. cx-169]|uniref:hypothetical protein n=1 Tax=Leucobacter sp. cx-169 TaxID=2770549 RepID=UPI00165E51D9|nr:hypothetical protein [Leucobacter sp. cx-169]MBC9927198.1 hypothetical protein [Leucobacter sp. cx-169]